MSIDLSKLSFQEVNELKNQSINEVQRRGKSEAAQFMEKEGKPLKARFQKLVAKLRKLSKLKQSATFFIKVNVKSDYGSLRNVTLDDLVCVGGDGFSDEMDISFEVIRKSGDIFDVEDIKTCLNESFVDFDSCEYGERTKIEDSISKEAIEIEDFLRNTGYDYGELVNLLEKDPPKKVAKKLPVPRKAAKKKAKKS
jgi:hypothetical protein